MLKRVPQIEWWGTEMSDFAVIAASMQSSLQEIAKQAESLGTGLQNAAPSVRFGASNSSVQYLLSIAEELNKIAESCGQLLENLPTQKSGM